MHSHGLRGFACFKKISALSSPDGGGNTYSPSHNIVEINSVTEMAFLLYANTIKIQGHSLDAWEAFFSEWEINIEKHLGWLFKKE